MWEERLGFDEGDEADVQQRLGVGLLLLLPEEALEPVLWLELQAVLVEKWGG